MGAPDADLRLTIADESAIGAAGEAVRSCAADRGLGAERSLRMQAVVEELVREAFAREALVGNHAVTVEIFFDGSSLAVEVGDQRLPISADEARHLPSRRLHRLGMVDSLRVGFRGSEGNSVRCEARLDRGFGDDHDHIDPVDAHDGDSEEDANLADAVEIRAMEPSDAEGLVRCLYRCYGYSYPDHSLYDVSMIRARLRRGMMRSVIAVLPDGEIVGHIAYVYERLGDSIPESGRLIVDPRLRGRHLADRMAIVRDEIARDLGVKGMWAKAVTNHAASQKVCLTLGSVETGLAIGSQPSGVSMAGMPNPHGGWRSLLIFFRAFRSIGPREIYVPEDLRPLVALLAERLGIDRTFAAEASGILQGRTGIEIDLALAHGLAHLRVTSIGSDVVARVSDEVSALAHLSLGAIHLDVPLADPSAPMAIEALERLGFAWSGWIPEFAPSGDVIRLQRVGDHPVDLESIVYARSEARDLGEVAIAQWQRVRRVTLGVAR